MGWSVSGLFPKPHQYPSFLMASLGIDPSTTRTNGSSSPRSALKNHSRKSSAPPTGPHSKSMSGQWTAILGSPGRAPSAISSMLGCVAAVSATESPSQLSPALIHKTWTTVSSGGASVTVKVHTPYFTSRRVARLPAVVQENRPPVNECLLHHAGFVPCLNAIDTWNGQGKD